MISIIIPVYNEERDIGECLASLQKQSYRNTEIIVVDDGSTDRTREIVRKFRKVKLIKGQHKGPGFSRNLGAKKAKGKILMFVDADMTFDKNYIKNLVKPILTGKTIGTEEGRQIALNQENVWSRCWGTHFKDYSDVKKGYVFRAILRKEFLGMGGFDPKYGYADDQTFYLKYGVNSTWVPNAICYHNNPETLKETFRQSRWIGASIQNKFLELNGINYVVPFVMIVASPIVIPILSVKKCIKNKDWSLFFPKMFIFMGARYFGTVSGIYRKIYLQKNVR